MQTEHQREIVRALVNMDLLLGSKVDHARIMAYAEHFKGEDLIKFKEGCCRYVNEGGEFFPSISQLNKFMGKGAQVLGLDEFEKIREHVRRKGIAAKIEGLSLEGSKALRSVGGLRAVGMCQTEEMHWLQRRFLDAHGEYAEAVKSGHLLDEGKPSQKVAGLINQVVERTGKPNDDNRKKGNASRKTEDARQGGSGSTNDRLRGEGAL